MIKLLHGELLLISPACRCPMPDARRGHGATMGLFGHDDRHAYSPWGGVNDWLAPAAPCLEPH